MSDEIMFNADDLLQSILTKSARKKDGSFEDASEDLLDVAERLINTLPEFNHVQPAKIKYLFKTGNWTKIGECAKTSGKWRHLTEFDFVIVIHKETWEAFAELQREALMHHEISHIGRAEDKWVIVRHDVEEFLITFKRYGAWHGPLQALKSIMEGSEPDDVAQLPIDSTLPRGAVM